MNGALSDREKGEDCSGEAEEEAKKGLLGKCAHEDKAAPSQLSLGGTSP